MIAAPARQASSAADVISSMLRGTWGESALEVMLPVTAAVMTTGADSAMGAKRRWQRQALPWPICADLTAVWVKMAAAR